MLFVLLLFGLAEARLPFLEFHFDDQEYKEDRREKETNIEIQKEFGTDYSYVDVKDAALHGDYEAKTKQSLTKDIEDLRKDLAAKDRKIASLKKKLADKEQQLSKDKPAQKKLQQLNKKLKRLEGLLSEMNSTPKYGDYEGIGGAVNDVKNAPKDEVYEYIDEADFRSGSTGVDPEICNCGKMDLESSDKATRIVGGKEAKEDNHPWQVSLEITNMSLHVCGGSLISKRHVLTAAHCFLKSQLGIELKDVPSTMSVLLGLHDLDHGETAQRVEIAEVHLPPQFSWETLENDMKNDAAVVELKTDANMSPKVLPFCLPPASEGSSGSDYQTGVDSLIGKKTHISGWGKVEQIIDDSRRKKLRIRRSVEDDLLKPPINETVKSRPSTIEHHRYLREAEVELISAEECQRRAPEGWKVLSSQICGFTPGVDACQGDSGGPASVLKGGRHTLIGITSLGKGCGDERYPGFYTRVSSLYPWLINITAGYTVWDSNCKKLS